MSPKRSLATLIAVLVVVLVGLALGQNSCSSVDATHVPAELVDIWVTDTEKYADRFFTIRGTSITFGTGEGTSQSFIITNVERVPFVGDSLYTIEYTDSQGEPYKFSFFFRRGETDQIRLANQRVFVWVRSS
jgi:hypothetical protein